eukprot:CAMPEP_0114638590 /NCGR_PEP_ID=MMETSP0191-20121206/702_1 /TAXON_ID=126664 /ORGANISM="Sorites sp." /LENGTH=79 /DNA_ID=CAMNT_0001850369 /DNA_START=54 /DNA_END=290 /DNA_ORIENTATION=+
MAQKQTQDYIESLLQTMSEDATLEDLIRKIGEMQRQKILDAAQVEVERLQAIVDQKVQERRCASNPERTDDSAAATASG